MECTAKDPENEISKQSTSKEASSLESTIPKFEQSTPNLSVFNGENPKGVNASGTQEVTSIGQSAPSETTSDDTTVNTIDFKVNEVVWAKIKGHPHWPAKIKCFPSNRMVTVVWFNDYRTTKIYRTQLFKFLVNFDSFAKNFDSTIGLRAAAQEGLMYYGNSMAQ